MLAVYVDVILLVRKLRMFLEMIDMVDEPSARVLASCFAVLTFVMLIVHYFVCEPAPLQAVVEVCCPSLSYQCPYVIGSHRQK